MSERRHFGPELTGNDRLCSFSASLSSDTCGAPASRHVLFIDEEGDLMHGWACDAHLPVAGRMPHEAHHAIGADCGMPGALFYNPPNCCRCPGEFTESPSYVVAVVSDEPLA